MRRAQVWTQFHWLVRQVCGRETEHKEAARYTQEIGAEAFPRIDPGLMSGRLAKAMTVYYRASEAPESPKGTISLSRVPSSLNVVVRSRVIRSCDRSIMRCDDRAV